jgi:hypothetical protein
MYHRRRRREITRLKDGRTPLKEIAADCHIMDHPAGGISPETARGHRDCLILAIIKGASTVNVGSSRLTVHDGLQKSQGLFVAGVLLSAFCVLRMENGDNLPPALASAAAHSHIREPEGNFSLLTRMF